MAARAIWKAVIRLGETSVPVKLYSAVEDRGIHFRLLHAEDLLPLRQAMVNPETDQLVPYEAVRKGYVTDDGRIVVLEKDELKSLEPDASRDIEVSGFLPAAAIDHRWYDRPYWLGPDGSSDNYYALAAALGKSGREGLAHWVMRGKEYTGALRLHGDHPMLITLRHAEEVVVASELKAPGGRDLEKKELTMAGQLMGMLEETFDPADYRDEYRQRVLELIESKAAGRKVKFRKAPRKKAVEDLSKALRESLKKERKVA